jgi:hypothetical protein
MWHRISDQESLSQASRGHWLTWPQKCMKAVDITLKLTGGLWVSRFTNAFTTRYGMLRQVRWLTLTIDLASLRRSQPGNPEREHQKGTTEVLCHQPRGVGPLSTSSDGSDGP